MSTILIALLCLISAIIGGIVGTLIMVWVAYSLSGFDEFDNHW